MLTVANILATSCWLARAVTLIHSRNLGTQTNSTNICSVTRLMNDIDETYTGKKQASNEPFAFIFDVANLVRQLPTFTSRVVVRALGKRRGCPRLS